MFTGRMRIRVPGIFAPSESDTPSFGCTVRIELVRLHADRALGLEREVRHRLQRHRDLGDLAGEPLAGAQVDRHARPAPVVDLEPQRHVGLRAASRPARPPRRGSRPPPCPRPCRPCSGRARPRPPRGGATAWSTFTFSSRTSSASNVTGGSMHSRLSSWSMWFWTRSRSAPDAVVVARAPADAHVLGRRDLDVVDEVAVPDRLEHAVREPERQHVLDRLLPQVVVDPVDLRLVEHRQHLAVQRPAPRPAGCRTASRSPRARRPPCACRARARRASRRSARRSWAPSRGRRSG